ncbi:MAG TPA: fumarylacetoacetate hydrolase family protein [Acidobacteriota bacterium]|nr:fumarylacetoacetate hydrolase family protein [Acidobacteriota bacterium]
MRWVRFDDNGRPAFGVLREDRLYPASLTWAEILQGRPPRLEESIDARKASLLAPLQRPGKIVAIGLNYRDHCREQKIDIPDSPLMFTKFTTAIANPGQTVRWSRQQTQRVDFEAELAVLIGRQARDVSPGEALGHVFGYTAANDVSARDLQFADGQWVRGKSLDTFCPLGPMLVTADEIPSPQNLSIRCRINGKTMQDSSTSEMIFPVAELISFCSRWFTLEAGDLILTGTPHGVGMFREPPLFLEDGDHMEVEIEGIGRLQNTCRVGSRKGGQ